MKIIGVNGINTHGEDNVDLMMKGLQVLGYETVDVKLPKRHTIGAAFPWNAKKDAEIILDDAQAEDGDVVIAHSFGCFRTAKAMKKRDFRAVFLFRPAMSHKYKFPHRSIDTEIFCFYSSSDRAVRLGSWIPFHPFGKAGVIGFEGHKKRPRIHFTNIESVGKHGADFKGLLLGANIDFVDQQLRRFSTEG